ncbi:transcriptional regulator [Aurantiacibacter spongiae]|uniref:Transcriptional regulator n=1 Tax=Aurantiacibacter spongiae TaxID=2488860 RepID=A0A3N5CTX2_9SPHN|nr:transcriptional regulator [Aurantiacibacter spongiae]
MFPARSRTFFAASYPEGPCLLSHDLVRHPLLELDALAELGESLPAESVEYNRGDVSIGVDGKPAANGLTIGQTIRQIADAQSWAVLKNIEHSPLYAQLVADLLEELRDSIEPRTGALLGMHGFVFVSSPNAVTPYHFDPEHNILLQLRGSKVMTLFPAGVGRFAPDERHEAYHTGGARELIWQPGFICEGVNFPLCAGDAVHVPVMAPHFVTNGPEPSISLSITWRSEWSYAEADARAFNRLLRRFGRDPEPPGRWPARNRMKALGWRIARRIPGLG